MWTFALGSLTLSVALAVASGSSVAAVAAAPSSGNAVRETNDYAKPAFSQPLAAGLRHFYSRDFKAAQGDFERALAVVPDNSFALSFLGAAAAHQPGALDALANVAEDAAAEAPKNYVNRLRLGFAYVLASLAGRDRLQDARDEFNAALALAPNRPAAHVGLGILRFTERSANRAKAEFLAALALDPADVLAREYLALLYQSDLRDPQRGLTYAIGVPNLVPGYADIRFHIGALLYDLGQPRAALEQLEAALALDPGNVGEAQHAYALIARIDLQQRDLEGAKKTLERSLAANVDTIIAKHLLEKIERGDYAPPKAKS